MAVSLPTQKHLSQLLYLAFLLGGEPVNFEVRNTVILHNIETLTNEDIDFLVSINRIALTKVEEIKKIGEEIYDEYVSPKLWQGTFEIAKSHLDKGEEVWLVTAAPQDMANIIASRLGLTGALGSKASIENGIYTGVLEGKLLHGIEKAIAIQELAELRGFNLDDCFSYSDSHNDIPLLQAVGHPCAINPDAILRIRALAEGWPIHDFRRARFINRLLGPAVSRIAALVPWLIPRKR